MTQYGKSEYWDERYSRDIEPFDWYQRFAGVKDIISQHIQPDAKILNLGCGNSRLSEEMYEEGFQNIVNIDVSSVVIKAMQEKYKDKGPSFKYLHMDARQLEFEEGQFDCVVDKGTLDTILCGEASATNTQKVLSEVCRVLAPGGVYIIISYGTPDHRTHYLSKPELNWKVLPEATVFKPTISTSIAVSKEDKDSPNYHYIYICKKAD